MAGSQQSGISLMYGRHGNKTKVNERQEIIYVLYTGWHRAVRLL